MYFGHFQAQKEILWARMNYRCMVSVQSLDRVMYLVDHWCWSRDRRAHHGGAIRDCARPSYEVNLEPQGPDGHPMPCNLCKYEIHRLTHRSVSSGYWARVSTNP